MIYIYDFFDCYLGHILEVLNKFTPRTRHKPDIPQADSLGYVSNRDSIAESANNENLGTFFYTKVLLLNSSVC